MSSGAWVSGMRDRTVVSSGTAVSGRARLSCWTGTMVAG